ncbi:MAG: diaminopimelate epimerase [Wenzhouxiangella sp.]
MSKTVPFTKLEALGNDFVLIDARKQAFHPDKQLIQASGDRRRGIGFDQLLILDPPPDSDTLCTVRIFNCDGSAAEQCGNGMRAIALWLHEAGEFATSTRIKTAGGEVEVSADGDGVYAASLGPPNFRPQSWGGRTDKASWTEQINGQEITLHGVSIGNPHLVVPWARPPSQNEVQGLGTRLSRHERLAGGANISLASVRDRQHIDLAVFERGAGPTLACGSGACATAAVMIRLDLVDRLVTVAQPGGELVIHWPDTNQPISMAGPARRVFEGLLDQNLMEPKNPA